MDGYGNPNDPEGEYTAAVEILYALSYTIKMGLKSGKLNTDDLNFPDYTIPPLEGLWWLNDLKDHDFTKKDNYCWISMIRQPDFITSKIFEQAKHEVRMKKPNLAIEKARLETYEEGLCVHCMHIGPFDTESETMSKMDDFTKQHGLMIDIGTEYQAHIRRHHEIYLSDPRKTDPSKMKTILRHPVRYV